MAIQQNTNIPEIRDTIVMLREMSADDKIRQEVYYREKQQHDEASALGHARREGIAEGMEIGITQGIAQGIAQGTAQCRASLRDEKIAEMRKLGFTEEQIKAVWG